MSISAPSSKISSSFQFTLKRTKEKAMHIKGVLIYPVEEPTNSDNCSERSHLINKNLRMAHMQLGLVKNPRERYVFLKSGYRSQSKGKMTY